MHRNHINLIIFFSALSLLIVGRMLAPGYILTLDMVWTPDLPTVWSQEAPNNAYPIALLLHGAATIIPSWIVQKAMLVSLFFLIGYAACARLPAIENQYARIFAASLYVLNPFVYSRMLAGQWPHLFAYALLPIALGATIDLVRKPNAKTSILLAITLACIGFFSTHFFFLSVAAIGIALIVSIAAASFHDRKTAFLRMVWAIAASCMLLIASSFWLVPALRRASPLEARFDEAHFEAFSAGRNAGTPTMLNVAALGGFWGEEYGWRYYFSWPQSSPLFWASFIAIFSIIAYGAIRALCNPSQRTLAISLSVLGVTAYVIALGAADTPFKHLNLFFYEHMPFWSGLRDSHKAAGLLALSYAFFAGIGAQTVIAVLKRRKTTVFAAVLAFAFLPIFFGMYMWGGFQGQLRPVWYPKAWHTAKQILDGVQTDKKALVLPWHGYLSLDFNNNLVVANPALSFFGAKRVYASRSIEIKGVYDQESDDTYSDLDELATETADLESIHKTFTRYGIEYVLVIAKDAAPEIEPPENAQGGARSSDEADDGGRSIFDIVGNSLSVLVEDDSVTLYSVNSND